MKPGTFGSLAAPNTTTDDSRLVPPEGDATKRSDSRELDRFSPCRLAALGLGVVLVLASFVLTACGEAQPPGASVSLASLITTTTLPGAIIEPSDSSKSTGPWLGEADVEAAGLMLRNHFFPALLQGDVEQLRSMLVAERRGETEALRADAQARAKSSGPEAVSGGSIRPLVWTGEKYAWDPPLPVPSDLDRWIKDHPNNRLGLQVILGDNVLWWFGMEQTASGQWLVLPGPRDEEYRNTHTLAGLQPLVLEAAPRSGVQVKITLRQMPGSGAVSPDLVIENKSDSVFVLSSSDLELAVDGVVAPLFVQPHSSGSLEVGPGETQGPGTGWFWHFEQPTSTSTRLSYTLSDPQSDKLTWVVVVGKPPSHIWVTPPETTSPPSSVGG